MKIEYLYAAEDIPLLVDMLYRNGYFLIKRSGIYCNQLLTQDFAVSILLRDLLLPTESSFWIVNNAQDKLLVFCSCSRQSHPCNLGKRGRSAGIISSDDRPINDEMRLLFKAIQSYFKKEGVFQRYNGDARMSCYWLKHYVALNDEYFRNPYPNHICRGMIYRTCRDDSVDACISKINQLPIQYPAIKAISYFTVVLPDGDAFCVEYLCDFDRFSFSEFQSMSRSVLGHQKIIANNHKIHMISRTEKSLCRKESGASFPEIVLIDNPWGCWRNQESYFPEKTVVIWPNY